MAAFAGLAISLICNFGTSSVGLALSFLGSSLAEVGVVFKLATDVLGLGVSLGVVGSSLDEPFSFWDPFFFFFLLPFEPSNSLSVSS